MGCPRGSTWRWIVLLRTTSRPLTGEWLHDAEHCEPSDEVAYQPLDGLDAQVSLDVTCVVEE